MSNTKTETPADKATRLGVPLVKKIIPVVPKQDDNEEEEERNRRRSLDSLMSYLNTPVKVCEECSKVITRADEKGVRNCFNGNCPCNNGVKYC